MRRLKTNATKRSSRKKAVSAPKRRGALAGAKGKERHVFSAAMKRRNKQRTEAADRLSVAEDKKILEQYHGLVDKKLQAVATAKDLADLELLENKIQAIEDATSAGFDQILERRHRAMMEKLTVLTDELRKLSASAAP
jgi:hypothetical protein